MNTISTEATDSTSESAQAPPATFDDIPLSDPVRRAIEDMGWVEPTPVQLATYEPAVEGRDLIVQARTGTGKTAAFGIPLVDRLIDRDGGPQALILAPTRELALQSSREIDRIAAHKGMRTVAVYGGAPMERQVKALQQGAQIVSGTPGRVLDHLKRGTLDGEQLTILVLDEADEMLSMGFARELNAIIDRLPAKRQTLLYSATVDGEVQRMAQRHMTDPEFLTLSGDEIGATSVSHFVYLIGGTGRARDLVRVLEVEDPESAVIFCNTRAQTEATAAALQQAGYDADWLNGDLPQSEREKVMARTRNSELRFLVATDVAARGIDISHLTHVINCEFPQDVAQYIHRTGRTGRAGRTGTAISLVAPQELGSLYYLRLQYKIFPIERSLPTAGEERTRAEQDRIEMLVAAFEGGVSEIDRAVARRLLTHPHVERIVGGLLRTFFGGSAEDVAEEAAAARRSRLPAPAPAPAPAAAPAPPRSRERQSAPREEARDRARATTEDDEGHAVLFVSVGRRDGVRPGDLLRFIGERTDLPREEVGKIRIRDKHTFVGVPDERAEEIIEALNGQTAWERELLVERARQTP